MRKFLIGIRFPDHADGFQQFYFGFRQLILVVQRTLPLHPLAKIQAVIGRIASWHSCRAVFLHISAKLLIVDVPCRVEIPLDQVHQFPAVSQFINDCEASQLVVPSGRNVVIKLRQFL